ncbi:hemerythrin domain-containing protein [Paenibacillus oenotherae]|uniref:Hemerythrin domain-containing protein n=1 Tax=Paenibacillus oenotherae TaxID=1435645 RepID=A0ABS7DB83_9BACL|nr:hemerythrin domain-containing protein [Paenibacillus oenotherae]
MELEPFNSARPSVFMMLAMKLKEDHDRLKDKVAVLCRMNQGTNAAAGSTRSIHQFEGLLEKVAHLKRDLKRHAKWEEQELFPVFARYFRKKIEPTMLPSMWVLEKDYELALQFLDSFEEQCSSVLGMLSLGLKQYDVITIHELKFASDQLTQGCLILKGHLHMEEELIYPLAEEILTDIDYLFS